MFIVSITYTQPIECIEAHLPAHVAFLDRCYAQGWFLMSGRKVPRTGGVIVMQAASLTEAQRILAGDPFQQQGLADYQITEFIPSKTAPALAAWRAA